ncbi:MAG: rhomboid family intramembrane serine protease [Candidatus Izemoplasma sp.]
MSVLNQSSDLKTYLKESPVTAVILLVNTFFLLAVVATGGFTGINLVNWGGLYVPYVENGEYYRLFVTMFLHGSVFHFLSNMIIGVYVLSSGLEKLIGSIKFSIIYFVSGIGASIVILFLSDGLTIGASGAIFGVLGAYIYIVVNKKDMLSKLDKQSLTGLVVINIIVTFTSPGISIPGHIGGFAIGYLVPFLLNLKEKGTDEDTIYF